MKKLASLSTRVVLGLFVLGFVATSCSKEKCYTCEVMTIKSTEVCTKDSDARDAAKKTCEAGGGKYSERDK